MRTTPLDDPEQWPVYGSLISDSVRAVPSSSGPGVRVVPTDTGALRLPPASSPVWARLRRQGGRSG